MIKCAKTKQFQFTPDGSLSQSVSISLDGAEQFSEAKKETLHDKRTKKTIPLNELLMKYPPYDEDNNQREEEEASPPLPPPDEEAAKPPADATPAKARSWMDCWFGNSTMSEEVKERFTESIKVSW